MPVQFWLAQNLKRKNLETESVSVLFEKLYVLHFAFGSFNVVNQILFFDFGSQILFCKAQNVFFCQSRTSTFVIDALSKRVVRSTSIT